MALIPTPDASRGILDAIKGSLGLFSDTNKAYGNDKTNPIPIDEYESSMSEEEIIILTSQWKNLYSVYYRDIEKGQKQSRDYWIGKHKNQDSLGTEDIAAIDNLLFESVETFLPIATRANPDPLISADPSNIGQEMAHAIKISLVNWADTVKLRRKLARMTRGWLLNRIGVVKLCWNPITKSIELDVINGRKMIFDRDGYIDEGGHFVGDYIGENKKMTAEKLIEMFPKKRTEISKKAQGKLGTKIDYIEWWYCNTDVFFTMDDVVLGKFKNPHWNYDGKVIDKDPLTDEPVERDIQGTNHLKQMANPYLFLSVFSTGEQPHDDTSLIIQNIPLQDTINRREKQIEDNVRGMNNGIIVSGTAFTEEQAAQAASALRRGMAIRVPNGKVGDSVEFPQRPGLPSDVFGHLRDSRQELRNIFGTAGSSAEGVKSQETVRGKVLVNQMDSSRIGGGVTEYIEQVADSIYNLVVQFMFVYYDDEHFVISAGQVGGTELVTIKNDIFPLLKTLSVTVKEGSLIPKDPLTQRNEAIDLWSANAIDPRTLFKKLDFPDPNEATKQLLLWQMVQKGVLPPQAYIPDFQAPPSPLPQRGVGDQNINTIDASNQPQIPTPTSQEAVGQESKQLLQSVPV